MVKSASQQASKRKNPFRWWRGILGALLACLFVVPYLMGSDSEKYLRSWVEAVNQGNKKFHIEVSNYHRHWFTSDGELTISSDALPAKISLQFTTYHGPLFINVGRPLRIGLGYFKGSFDSRSLLGQQQFVQADGPVQVTAFLPYFNDRELHATFPPITISDKENKLNYQLQAIEGELDGADSLQMTLPTLKVSDLDGKEVVNLDSGLFRIVPGSYLASFSAKQVDIYPGSKRPATINNLVIQANTETPASPNKILKLLLNLHFDQLQLELNPELVPSPLDLGPFEFNVGISGIQTEGIINLVTLLKTLSQQKEDLSPDQAETLEKNLTQLFAPDALFDLSSSLNTSKGKINAQFQGGFNLKNHKITLQSFSDLVTAFYSKGSVSLAAEVKQALLDYSSQQETPEDENFGLPTLLGFFKKDPQGLYSSRIDIRDGKISLNGKLSSVIPAASVIPAEAGNS